MSALLDLLLYFLGAIFGLAAFYNVLGDKNRAALANWLKNFLTARLESFLPLLNALEAQLQPITSAFVTAIEKFAPTISRDVRIPVDTLVRATIAEKEIAMVGLGVSTPDNFAAFAAQAMSDAFIFGAGSALTSAAFEAVLPEKLNTLNAVGPIMASMAGFDEVTKEVLAPLYKNAFGKSAEYHWRSVFKPEFPDEADAVLWHARRFLTDDQLRAVFAVSGLKPEYETPYINSAYRAVQPRVLATLFQDVPFPRDQIQGMLERAGIFPQDVPVLLDGFEFASVKNVRNQYLSATITAAERGTLTPAEVDSALTDLTFSDQAKHWVQLTIATRKLEQLAEIYRKEVSALYKFSLITDAQYVPSLEAIGIAQADANAHYALDSANKLGHEAAAAARAAAKLEAEVTRAASKAALANYAEHNIDELALAAALAVAGVPAQVIPWAVDVAALRRQAIMRNVFGKRVTTDAAVLLREQVAALKEQVIKKLLDTTSARTQLQNLGLPPTDVEDLLARWAAQALKTVLPVQ